MAILRLFGPARTAAGSGRVEIEAPTVRALCEAACERFGAQFGAVLRGSALWVNGEPAEADHAICDADEVAVVPPVSGGA